VRRLAVMLAGPGIQRLVCGVLSDEALTLAYLQERLASNARVRYKYSERPTSLIS
jgi:hypothetical protein